MKLNYQFLKKVNFHSLILLFLSVSLLSITTLSISNLLISDVYAIEHTDFDGDGKSDFAFITVKQDGALNWQKLDVVTQDQNIQSLNSFGFNGNHLAVGNWITTSSIDFGVISLKKDNKLTWKIQPRNLPIQEFKLGDSKSTAISGADLNGNGFTDAIVVNDVSGSRLKWSLLLDPLSSAPSKRQQIIFGKKGDIPFYFNTDGFEDKIAILRKGKDGSKEIVYRALNSSKTKSIKLGRSSIFKNRPAPLKDTNGKDLLVFSINRGNNTLLSIYNSLGKRIAKGEYNHKGELLVGNYNTNLSGEELGIYDTTDGTFGVVGKSLKDFQSFAYIRGVVPFDEVNINNFVGISPELPVPVATPTPVNTVKPSNTVEPISGPNPFPIDSPSNPNVDLNPPNTTCSVEDSTDGQAGFLWKPISDTQRFVAVVLPPKLTNNVNKVEVYTSTLSLIKALRFKGVGNGDRTNWQDTGLTGNDYKRIYGSVYVKAVLDSGKCILYEILHPETRTD